jgi:pyroglutamyl-peptidase
MPPSRPIVLLTGFGPFPGMTANATQHLVPRLADAARQTFPGHRIVADVLPTEWHAGPERLSALLEAWAPAVALHFGVSGRAAGFEIEARARNVMSKSSKDAAGNEAPGPIVAANGAAVLSTPLPAQHIVDRLRRRGLPAILSRDAGTYVCNTILYSSLCRAQASAGAMRSGFVHVPAGLGDPRRPSARLLPGCALDWHGAIDGGLEIIATCLGLPPRPRVGAFRG